MTPIPDGRSIFWFDGDDASRSYLRSVATAGHVAPLSATPLIEEQPAAVVSRTASYESPLLTRQQVFGCTRGREQRQLQTNGAGQIPPGEAVRSFDQTGGNHAPLGHTRDNLEGSAVVLRKDAVRRIRTGPRRLRRSSANWSCVSRIWTPELRSSAT